MDAHTGNYLLVAHVCNKINMFQYNSADDPFGNKEEISARQITIK